MPAKLQESRNLQVKLQNRIKGTIYETMMEYPEEISTEDIIGALELVKLYALEQYRKKYPNTEEI